MCGVMTSRYPSRSRRTRRPDCWRPSNGARVMSARCGYRRAMKRLLAMTIAGCVSIMVAGPAAATATADLDEVAAALRENPVYVDATAERAFAEDEREELRAAIRGAN